VYGYYDRLYLESFIHMDWEPAIDSEEVFLTYCSYERVVIIKHVSISVLSEVIPCKIDASFITKKVVRTINYLLNGKFLKFACLNLSCGFN
jgi:hypothetical protein